MLELCLGNSLETTGTGWPHMQPLHSLIVSFIRLTQHTLCWTLGSLCEMIVLPSRSSQSLQRNQKSKQVTSIWQHPDHWALPGEAGVDGGTPEGSPS